MKLRNHSYITRRLHETVKHGIAPCTVGVYQILVGLVGLFGLLLTWIARQAMNRSIKPYLQAKKRIPPTRIVGPVFVSRALHPHGTRTDAQLPEWKPIERPSTLQDRGGR